MESTKPALLPVPAALWTIDHCDAYFRGVQSCFRFERICLRTMKHVLSYSVFGRIDFFRFSKPCLSPGVKKSPKLFKVSSILFFMAAWPTLAAFDLFILFKRPSEFALRRFDILFSNMHLRLWVVSTNKSSYHDEYLQLREIFARYLSS